jgi:hypothetical protein
MRRLLRIILWMVKGLMLLIALAALVMWPVSRGRILKVTADRFGVESKIGEWRSFWTRCWDGRFDIGYGRRTFLDSKSINWVDTVANVEGKGWRWNRTARQARWAPADWPNGWGPLRWDLVSRSNADGTNRYWAFAAPLWLVALVTGTWPLASITLALRRRIKRRRAAREGLCKNCGYDLRATPTAGGALLAVCPECGQKTSAGDTPSPPPS